MRLPRRHLSYANVVSLTALVLTTAGTGFAAKLYTGANVKDGSLTAAHVKNATIELVDISTGGIDALKGPKGAMGPQGDKGPRGADGLQGDAGDTGANAKSTTSWAYQDTGLVRNFADSYATPNNPAADWDAKTYGSANSLGNYPNIRTGAYNDIGLENSERDVVSLSGMTQSGTYNVISSSGTTITTYQSNLSAVAHLTFLHRNHGETNDYDPTGTPGIAMHGRMECNLVYGNTGGFTPMGAPHYVTSNEQHELVDIVIVANAANVSAGNYNVKVQCQDADYTGLRQWSFVSGDLSVLAAQQ